MLLSADPTVARIAVLNLLLTTHVVTPYRSHRRGIGLKNIARDFASVQGKCMYSGAKKFTQIVALVLATPMLTVAPGGLKGNGLRPQQSQVTEPTAGELQKMEQLRELCFESDRIQMELDFAIRKLRDKASSEGFANPKPLRGIGRLNDLEQVKIGFLLAPGAIPFTTPFPDSGSRMARLVSYRNHQVQKLRDRNARYFSNLFEHVAQYGPQAPSTWDAVRAKHDELGRILVSGEFQACIAELNQLLPSRLTGGRNR